MSYNSTYSGLNIANSVGWFNFSKKSVSNIVVLSFDSFNFPRSYIGPMLTKPSASPNSDNLLSKRSLTSLFAHDE